MRLGFDAALIERGRRLPGLTRARMRVGQAHGVMRIRGEHQQQRAAVEPVRQRNACAILPSNVGSAKRALDVGAGGRIRAARLCEKLRAAAAR